MIANQAADAVFLAAALPGASNCGWDGTSSPDLRSRRPAGGRAPRQATLRSTPGRGSPYATYPGAERTFERLAGLDYRPQLADLPDARLWRIDPAANYGPLNSAARGKIDLSRIRRQWPDILRVVASIHTRAVPGYCACSGPLLA